MPPASIDVSRLPDLLNRCTRAGDLVRVPDELRRMVVAFLAAKFPFETTDEIPLIGGLRKVTGFSNVRLRRELTRIEGETVVIIGTMKISFGNKLTESGAFDETFDFVADVSPNDISVIISHPTSH